MQLRENNAWMVLIIVAGILSLAYLWNSIFPGKVPMEAYQYFRADMISKSRQYAQDVRLVYIVHFIVQIGVLIWLVFSKKGEMISDWTGKAAGSYWGGVMLYFLVLWLLLKVVAFPFNLYSGYYLQHNWGFLTQTFGAWVIDYIKSSGLDFVLSAIGVTVFFALLNYFSNIWWLIGAIMLSLWLIVQSFFWPIIIAPLFNNFVEVKDPAVIKMVNELAEKANINVDKVMVIDASRRTTRVNAYFTGLGNTKRIVLYDNLLTNYPKEQVEAVIAHEMAHWSQGHIIKGIMLGIIGIFAASFLLFLYLRPDLAVTEKPQPNIWAASMLFILMISFASSPVQNYFSRAFETQADRVSIELTGDIQAAVKLQENLAVKNLSDVSPPSYIRWFSYTHPPTLERIKALKSYSVLFN